jgi:hypothetical protein
LYIFEQSPNDVIYGRTFTFCFFCYSETYSAEIRAAIGQMDGILDSQRDSEGYSEYDEKVPSRKVSKQSSEETPSRKISRLELNVKKDSGYGSQGLIAVDQV